MYQTRRDFLKTGAAALIAGSIVFSPLEKAVADTIYYGDYKPKEKQSVAYVEYYKVASESKYVVPPRNDSRYNIILNQRNNSVSKAISDVAGDVNGKYKVTYDVVVEKDDPEVKGYVDISENVVKRLKENEK